MLFVNWWMELGLIQQVFWSAAIVSSVLLIILLFISLFSVDAESEPATRERRFRPVEPKVVLVALTVFSWTAVLLSYHTAHLQTILLISAATGLAGALLPWLLAPLLERPAFDADAALCSTGEVLKPVPPHRNGFGKVHINLRAAPYEMDAVTAGDELPAGVPVRVVDIIDEHVLVVEAIDERSGPKAPGQSFPSGKDSGIPPHR